MDRKDVVIIGAGPAGIAAAIQLKRCNVDALLLEQEEIGGLLRNANLVENYPGFPGGISGLDLIELFKRQLKEIGVKVSFEKVQELEYKDKVFSARTDRRVITSTMAVIASGTRPKRVSDLSIVDGAGDRIFYEVYPIRKVKNKKIAIIGAGDAAFDYGLGLSQNNKVMILNRSERVKCIPVLKERCMKSENISYIDCVIAKQVDKKGEGLLLTYTNGDSRNEGHVCADYVVIAVGREPCLDFLGSQLKKYFKNLIKTNALHVVGDIKNETYRQTAICVGDGVRAAMKIYRQIEGEEE